MFKKGFLVGITICGIISSVNAGMIHESIQCGGVKAKFSAKNSGIAYNENQVLLVNTKTFKFDDVMYYSNLACVTFKGKKTVMLNASAGNSYEGVLLVDTKTYKETKLAYPEASAAGLIKE